MNMPENSNISDSAQAERARSPAGEASPKAGSPDNFGEEAFDKKVSSIIYKDNASDDAIWQNTRELLEYELEKRLVWQRIGYFVSASAAAVIILAVVVYILLAPAGIPANWLSAMEQEHLSYINSGVKSDTTSPEKLSEQFRQKGLLEKNECCCALMGNNKNIQLQGGKVCNMNNCPYASIYAKYNGTPVSFFIFYPTEQPGLIAQSKLVHSLSQLAVSENGEFNVAIKILPDCIIGVIAKLDKQSLIDLIKDIDTLEGNCNCGCK